VSDKDAALAVILRAIQNELVGRRFYDDAAYHCIDPWAKEVFATLAHDEDSHVHLLLVEYETISAGGRWLETDHALAVEPGIAVSDLTFDGEIGPPDLFQGEATDVVDRKASDLLALATAIDMEQKAIALYCTQAEQVAHPAARAVYEYLVEEERRHDRLLKERWEALTGVPFGPQ
jgi:rubrerythrin